MAATDHLGYRSLYSNFSSDFHVLISAPGGDGSYYNDSTKGIYSTADSGTRESESPDGAWKNGTSMAAPHVAGTLALLLSAKPALSQFELWLALIETAQEFTQTSVCYRDWICGAGIVNAHAALQRVTADTVDAFTTVDVRSWANPVLKGEPFTIQADVYPSNVTGPVSWLYNGARVAGCTNLPLTHGSAACEFRDWDANFAGYELAVIFEGDYTHHWSYSQSIYQQVLPNLSSTPIAQEVVEYYHGGFDHYFITANPAEIAVLDAGAFGGAWKRTGGHFGAFPEFVTGSRPVCRFFSTSFSPKSSHFYTANAVECSGVRNNFDWQLENIAFFIPVPDDTGSCAPDTTPVYRLYNQGKGGAPNHRFTVDPATRSQMVLQGWAPEGLGLGVGFCAPH